MATTKSTTLFSLATLKSYLKINATNEDFDARLVIIADGISERIDQYCNRVFVTRTLTELYNGRGQKSFNLRNYPVVSIASIRVRYSLLDSWVTLLSTEYILDNSTGAVHFVSAWSPNGPLSLEAVYDAGYGIQDAAGLPSDVYQVGLDYAKMVYDKWDAGVIAADSLSIGPQSMSVVPGLPSDLKKTLDRRIARRIGGGASI